jgi:retinol dehydrogenase-12
MFPPIDQVTTDGYDLQFGTNVLGIIIPPVLAPFFLFSHLQTLTGHFYFTKLLLPTLIETAKTSPDSKVRVVNTSSIMHHMSGINFDILKDGPKRKKTSTDKLYAQSKFVRHIIYRV